MNQKKVLFITSEMVPFVPESDRSVTGTKLPQTIQEQGLEIRTFSPKWGIINERRNQLHEVIRLSGMNLVINETDHPLIIKVASLPSAKMQIYFIDNDDYFMKRALVCDKDGKEYRDNAERAVFYARGVLETVKKLRWVPDVIHCHGWIASLAPLFIKKAYADEPSFCNSKVVTTLLPQEFNIDLGTSEAKSVEMKGVSYNDISDICATTFTHSDLQKIAIKYSDGIVLEKEGVDPAVVEYAKSLGIPVLDKFDGDPIKDSYKAFYDTVCPLEEE